MGDVNSVAGRQSSRFARFSKKAKWDASPLRIDGFSCLFSIQGLKNPAA
jgi:hypothetical protein